MSAGKKVIVGLSGGVDSSVAAYLLKQQGFEVTGVTMSIWNGKSDQSVSGKHSCYGPNEDEEIREARELADMLNISHFIFDCSKRYKSEVLEYFRLEYLSGRTPNPCVKCNQLIKFGMLPELAREQGLEFDLFATGHYARIEFDKDSGRYLLKRAADQKKDQTYFIYRLSQKQLSELVFPLGDLNKTEVREIAGKINISLTEKSESQDFYSGDYKELLEVTDCPGKIVMRDGKILGTHQGIWNYTIGQRKGLGVAFTEPLYVIELDQIKNEVIVGIRDEVMSTSFIVNDLNWISVACLNEKIEVKAKIRSAQEARDAVIEPYENGSVKVTFFAPYDGITPGQSAVFYDGEMVVGGGVINRVLKNS